MRRFPAARSDARKARREPADWAGNQAPHLGAVVLERLAVDVEILELLVEHTCGQAVEEQLERENEHDHVVDAADDGDGVRDEVKRRRDVSGREAKDGLARQRHALVPARSSTTSRPYVGTRDASGRKAR